MSDSNQKPPRRVLIASANPLFAKGLQKLLAQRWRGTPVEFRLAGSMDEAIAALDTWQPHLVIVDYDDVGTPGNIQRGAFLSHFIAENRPMQVMLVSLRESGEVVVYDRRTLTPAQAEDWFDLAWLPGAPGAPSQPAPAAGPDPNLPPEQSEAPVTLQAASGMSETHHDLLRSGGMKRGGLTHYLIPAGLTVVMTLVLMYIFKHIPLLPTQGTTQFAVMSGMIDLQLWFISFLFSLITVFVVYSAVVYRHRPGDSGMGANFKQSNTLEVTWTIIPLGLVIFLAFLGSRDLARMTAVDPSALEVKVTAFQWGWQFEYPDNGGVKSNEMYLPVGRQVHLVMSSRDVIHSFWVPEFGIKQDVLPGANLVKELRVNPDKTGDYKVYCAELCGGAHAYMVAPIHVVEPAAFNTWIASKSNTANQPPEQVGQGLAQNNGCLACHTIDGSKGVGPTWKGLAGSQVKLADGSTVTADDAYLHESIIDPNKQIAAGFPPGVMPQNYKTVFDDKQIAALIAYIKTLK